MSVAAFLAKLRRAKRQDQPKVRVWISVWSPDDRIAAEISQ